MIFRWSLLILTFSIIACQEKSGRALDSKESKHHVEELHGLDWMLGKWKRQDTGELALWSKRENSFFGGMMVKVNENNKAVIQEVLSLEGRRDGVYFSTKDRGKKNTQRDEFKMSNENWDAPKFTNQSTGYPEQISYMKIGDDKIKVEEMGTSGEGTSYYYVRTE